MSLRRILALARAKLWTFINWRRSYYVTLLESTLYLVLFGAGFSAAVGAVEVAGQALPYREFLFAGLVAVASFRVFPFMIFHSANDMKWGMYRLYVLAGIRPLEYVIARGINAWLYFLAQFTVLLCGAALVIGPGVLLPGLLMALVAIPGVLFWSCLGVIIGTSIHDLGTRDLVATAALLPTVFSSSVLYSLERAPLFLRVLGRINPLTYQADSMRHVYAGDWRGGLLNVGVLLAAVIVLLVASSFLLPRMNLASKQRA